MTFWNIITSKSLLLLSISFTNNILKFVYNSQFIIHKFVYNSSCIEKRRYK